MKLTNTTKRFIQERRESWLAVANLLKALLEGGYYKIIAPEMTKPEFCELYLGAKYRTLMRYARASREHKKLRLNGHEVAELGVSRVDSVLASYANIGTLTKNQLREVEELKKKTILQIQKRSYVDVTHGLYTNMTKSERDEFQRRLKTDGGN